SKRDFLPPGQNLLCVVRGAVVDDDRFEVGSLALPLECIEHALQHGDTVVRWDDDGERWLLAVGRWPLFGGLVFGQRHAETPPSMHSTWPVMPLASSEIRKAMPAATSSAVIALRIGTSLIMARFTSSSSDAIMSVSTTPGATQL